ncbi:MAG: hypothetical protein K0V04_16230 [Deltaproteobacteria bacterium]|nr:hypothetical protein [Deltaproteobacteria bacterium]
MSRSQGVTAEQCLALTADTHRDDGVFDECDCLVIAYATAMTTTPVEVDDALFCGLRRYFDETQMVELTAAIAWENYRARFNHALHMESEGFSEAAVCVLPTVSPAAISSAPAPVPRASP